MPGKHWGNVSLQNTEPIVVWNIIIAKLVAVGFIISMAVG
jgi:hypothetical protein